MTTHFLLLLAALLINSICKASTIAKVILLIVVVVALLLLLFAVLYESHHAREVGKKVLIHAVNACLGYFAGYYHQSVKELSLPPPPPPPEAPQPPRLTFIDWMCLSYALGVLSSLAILALGRYFLLEQKV